jgi:hypothetical protein
LKPTTDAFGLLTGPKGAQPFESAFRIRNELTPVDADPAQKIVSGKRIGIFIVSDKRQERLGNLVVLTKS